MPTPEIVEATTTYIVEHHDPETYRRLGPGWEWCRHVAGKEFPYANDAVKDFKRSSAGKAGYRFRVIRIVSVATVVSDSQELVI